jgi:hypothetical protein
MYDMYPWDSAGPAGRTPKPSGTPRSAQDSRPAGDRPAPQATRATRAVQAALDRRDNGGDAAAAVDAVSQTMAGPPRQ